jgi:TonB-dependent receptor
MLTPSRFTPAFRDCLCFARRLRRVVLPALALLSASAARAEAFHYAKAKEFNAITLNVPGDHLTLGEFFRACEQQTSFKLAYTQSAVPLTKEITVTRGAAVPLARLLTEASNAAGVVFKPMGRQIAVRARRADDIVVDESTAKPSAAVVAPESDVATEEAEVVQLKGVVVEGYRQGRARSLKQKRTQTNVADIVSADAMGNLPDRNVAEGIARLPGVNLSLDQGDGRYVSIRGIEPNLNQVTIDGATMAAPGGTRLGRATPLDTLGMGQVSEVEVIKTTTPDLDANAIGGTISLRSVSAFDRNERFLAGSFSINRNDTTHAIRPEGQFTFSDVFGANKHWGLAASAGYDERVFSNDWIQAGWGQTTINGATVYLPNDFEIKPEDGNRKRGGVNFNLEYRLDADTQVYFRPSYSSNRIYDHRYETIFSTTVSPTGVTLTSPTTGVFNAAGNRTERREFQVQQNQDLLSGVGGIKKTLGDLSLEGMVTYSDAKEDRAYFNVRQFRNASGQTGPISFDLSGFVPARWDGESGVDTPANYTLRTTRDDTGLVEEQTSTAKLDARYDLKPWLQRNGFVKAGFKYTDRQRTADLESRRLIPAGTWSLAQVGTLPSVAVYENRYASGFRLDWAKINSFIANNPSLTTFDGPNSAANSIEDDYDIDEKIYAGYGMASIDLGPLTLLGGVRWERTDATISAVEARTTGGSLIGRFPTTGSVAYDKVLPNAQAVYHVTRNLLARAAVTETIGRPAYEDARPLAQFRYDSLGAAATDPNFPYTGTLSVGNPGLKPYDSINTDLSLEWYTKDNGLISLAAFRKQIDDPIYTYAETQVNVVHSGIPLQRLDITGKRNANSGRISGLEIGFYQPFKFLPAPFDGFGLDANYTRINSRESIPTRPGENLPFFRQPGKIGNVTLFYEKFGFSGRIAWTYADEQIYTLGSAPLTDIYFKARQQFDLQLRYRITEHYSITGSVRNLTREPEQYSYGIRNLIQLSRLLDRDYKLGVDFNF